MSSSFYSHSFLSAVGKLVPDSGLMISWKIIKFYKTANISMLTFISSCEDGHVDSNMCYQIIPYTFLGEVTLTI